MAKKKQKSQPKHPPKTVRKGPAVPTGRLFSECIFEEALEKNFLVSFGDASETFNRLMQQFLQNRHFLSVQIKTNLYQNGREHWIPVETLDVQAKLDRTILWQRATSTQDSPARVDARNRVEQFIAKSDDSVLQAFVRSAEDVPMLVERASHELEMRSQKRRQDAEDQKLRQTRIRDLVRKGNLAVPRARIQSDSPLETSGNGWWHGGE